MTMRVVLILAISCIFIGRATAQTIGYAGAIYNLAASCGKDIGRYCKTVNLGGGFGKEHLLNQRNPEAAENRRVQLINIGAAQ